MRVFVDLAGTGLGAQKQYNLIRKHRPHLFTNSEVNATHVLYWQCFTRHFDVLERRKRAGKKIIVRVGGFHRENATTTREMLRRADGAVFVCEWLKEWLKAKTWIDSGGKVKPWRLPPKRTAIHNGSEWVGPRDSDTPYLLIRCAQIGKVGFKRGLNRSFSIWALAQVWSDVRKHYPKLEMWVVGRYDRKTKHEYALPGWKWKGFKKASRKFGQGALGLVHLVPDYSPNTAAEMIAEGRSVICPDVGGTKELAGIAGRQVKFDRTDKREWPEVECAGHFYRIQLDDLLEGIVDVIENREKWKKKAWEQWGCEVDIRRTCDKYERFLDSV